jgi:hypothetical protein
VRQDHRADVESVRDEIEDRHGDRRETSRPSFTVTPSCRGAAHDTGEPVSRCPREDRCSDYLRQHEIYRNGGLVTLVNLLIFLLIGTPWILLVTS